MARHRPQLSVLRRSRQSPWRRWVQRGADLWNAALGLPALWLVLFLLAGTWCVMPSGFLFAPRARAGAIADQDYVAPRDLLLLDEESSRAKEARARDAVPAVYDFDPEIQTDRDRLLEALFRRGRELAGKGNEAPAGARLEAITAELAGQEPPPDGLRLTPAEAEVLARKRFSADLEDRLRGLLGSTLRRGVVANKGMLLDNRVRGISLRNLTTRVEQIQFDLFNHLGYPEEARDFLQSEVRGWTGLTVADRRLLAEILFDNLPVNLHFNQSETRSRRDAVAAAAGQVFTQVRKGQVIVRKGDQISATAARVISQIRGDRHLTHQLPPIAGTLFLVALAALALWLGLRRERVADHPPARVFGEMLMLLTLALLGARFCFMVASALSASGPPPFSSFVSYAYAVPFASLSLLAALLLTRNAALVLAFLFPLLASRMVDSEGLWVVFYGCAGSLAAVFALDQYQFKQRLVMTRVGLVVGAANMLLVLILEILAGGLADRGLAQVSFDLCCAFAGGLLVTAVASFMVPILESALGITTDIKLVELSNTNLPLLRRLAFEAPGTFQHSLMVANLAKEGCEAIGADPVLAYTGGLYHDVGKVFRPEYFIENQRPGQNRHDKLLPSMSALILINHVKEGLELAREHNLPQPIRDAVEQHHGTRLIKYFYNRAREQSDPATGEVREEKYRYPGPKPQHRVLGVLMLADGVEAASRTLVEPTPAKIRALIRTIVEDCLRDGQLDQTNLTLRDINLVGESFLRVLGNIFHQRIDYPGFDFNLEPGRDRQQAAQGVKAAADAAARAS